ncbi:MAG: cobalt ECF transporter T component CbiQ [Oscillatoria sp. SIO1A7]|nr:cobalt ECF transporter T component CbiQ [Oscillatoria sp. SIO1A7]
MNLQIDTLAYTNRLRTLPPEQKLLFGLGILAIAALSNSPVHVIIIFWMAVWIVGYARIPAPVYLKLLGLASLFLIISWPALVVNIVSPERIELIKADRLSGLSLGWWHFYVSRSACIQATVISLRSLASISCLLFILCTVPFTQILQALRRLGIPAILTELLLLMYRFVFILLNTADRLQLAQQARGGYRSRRLALNSISLLVGQLLKRTLQRYQQFSLGVAARGFRGNFVVCDSSHYSYSIRYALEAIIGASLLLGIELWSNFRAIAI